MGNDKIEVKGCLVDGGRGATRGERARDDRMVEDDG